MTTFTSAPRALLVGSLGLGLTLTAGACLDFGEAEETAPQPPQSSASTDAADGKGAEPDSAENANAEDPDAEDSAEAPSAAAEDESDAAGSPLELEAVTMDLPQDWALQEAPADYTASAWSAGAFDDEDSPTEFVRILPNLDESQSAEAGASRLVATGEFAEAYGENFETTSRGEADTAGAPDAHTVEFRYLEDGEEILGRWWVMADADTDTVSVVEHTARADVDPDFDATAEGITFDPDWEG